MPLLQFDTTLSPSDAEKTAFAERVTDYYTTEMATTAGHVAVTIREHEAADLHLGRAVEGPLLFLDAEIRRGRSFERKRAFALAAMEYAGDTFDVPDENMKVVFTEHPGEAMMGVDRVGGEWDGESDDSE
ncbi:4-oxalocrotonate tautomerase family protein [Natrinema sp. SYSU A 869]|uniref:4-oxalocrotonate tautomerase family protein n=1 Tax=Natrinema sp. SYSU A 869 TaxID=2871694 RepID=UPI001CA3F48E|nr:4-oxalocrotonate tautomerase family protein [Natrinema sp. SYSU A 869]